MRDRLDSLDDRQLRLLLHFLCGSASSADPRVERWFTERLQDGVEWLEGRGTRKGERG